MKFKINLHKTHQPLRNPYLRNPLILSPFVTISLLCSNAVYADATIEVIADNQPVTILVKDNKVRLQLSGAQAQNEAIFDQQTQTLHILDHRDQTIFPLDEKKVDELSGTISSVVGAMAQQLEGMSPEQRAKMEKLMGGDFGLSLPDGEVKPEISLSQVRQYSYSNIKCDESKVMEGDQELGTICVSQGNTTPLSEQDFESLMSAQRFVFNVSGKAKQFAKQYGQQIPDVGDLTFDGLLVNSLQTSAYGDSGANASFRIKAINVGAVDDIVIPADYRERSLLGSVR